MVIGSNLRLQREAAELLGDEGSLKHNEFRDILGLEREEMQVVVRGLIDNGVVVVDSSSSDDLEYSLASETIIDEVYGDL